MKKTERIAVVGVLAAFGAILSYIESVLSIGFGIPGVKLGLANIAVVVALYMYGASEALWVNGVRIIVVGLMFGNGFSIFFSLAGAVFSFVVMVLFKKTELFSPLGVSAVGGVAHNIGQMLVAMIVVQSYSVIYYIPALLIAGIGTGIVIGIICRLILRYTERRSYDRFC